MLGAAAAAVGVYPGWGYGGWVPGRAIPGTTHPPSGYPYLAIF